MKEVLSAAFDKFMSLILKKRKKEIGQSFTVPDELY